jgi:hypothetical protein
VQSALLGVNGRSEKGRRLVRTIGDSSALPPAGHRRARRRLLKRQSGPVLLAAAGVALAVLLAVTLVKLTGASGPAAGGPAGTAPTSTHQPTGGPATPERTGTTQGVAPEEAAAGAEGGGSGPEVCPGFPQFPDESCTGWRHTGVSLRPCPNVITQDGLTLDGCRFAPDLEIQASNVTITRSLVEGTVYATYLTDWSLGGLRLVDVEIDGKQRVAEGRSAAIGNDDYTCLRCHIHDSERGANLGRNVHIEDSYLHDWLVSPGAHQTAIGSNGGGGFTIVHNQLECDTPDGCSSALSLYEDFEPIANVLIQHNLFNTSGGYCTYAGQQGTNIRYIDNVFGTRFHPRCGEYGPVTDYHPNQGNVWRGNRYPDGSAVPGGDG